MEIIIFICGCFSVAFAIFHILFWRLFDWKNDLKNLNAANRGIIQILNSRIIYLCIFIAFVCFFYPDDLLNTTLGKVFLVGISLFWLGRAAEQFIFFKRQSIYLHILTVLFLFGAILFALPVVY